MCDRKIGLLVCVMSLNISSVWLENVVVEVPVDWMG